MSDLIGFDQGDDDVLSGNQVDFYRGEGGVTDRLSLCWFYEDDDGNLKMSEDDTPKFKRVKCHYIDGKGYVKSTPYIKEKEGPPKDRLGTFVVVYKTDDSGSVQKPFDYEVRPWGFGQDKFRDLKELHKEFPLTQHDFKARCEGEQFQKLKFTPSADEAIWQQKDSLKEEVLSTVEAIEDQLSLAREVDEQEMKEFYGDAEQPSPEEASDDDLDDIMEGLDD